MSDRSTSSRLISSKKKMMNQVMGVKKRWLINMLPFAAMVTSECLDVGLTTLSKSAMSQGMSHFVFVVYSNALATLILFPTIFLPYIFSTKRPPPPVTFQLLAKFFILGLIGITIVQNCVFTGVNYSSPTLGSAMSNALPAYTFVLAVIFRMEKVRLQTLTSQIKILGTIVSITGALIVIFYKGPSLWHSNSVMNLSSSPYLKSTSNWVIGGCFFAVATLSLATWNILQATVMKGYPSEMTVVFFTCLFGTIQCSVVSLIAERDPNAWKLKLDIELGAIVYSAVFGNAVSIGIQTWCIVQKGPVFVTMFKPLGIAVAAIFGAMFLGDTLHMGSLIGALFIVAGFYGVIWAQSREDRREEECLNTSPSHKRPLLHQP